MAEQTTRRAFELQLIEKAWKDAAFRQRLLADPQGTLEREVGGKLPARLKVKLVEETADTCYLVLPANPDRAPAGELADQQLEAVAGGWSGASDCGSCPGTCATHCEGC
jgi:hypothetical protein